MVREGLNKTFVSVSIFCLFAFRVDTMTRYSSEPENAAKGKHYFYSGT